MKTPTAADKPTGSRARGVVAIFNGATRPGAVPWTSLGVALIIVVGGGIAAGGNPLYVQVAINITIAATLALSWDILARSGRVSIGQAAFFGVGTYCSALLERYLPLAVAWVGAVLVCALLAAGVGAVTLRLEGMYFAIATLSLPLSLGVLALIATPVTGGAQGISPNVLFGGNHAAQLVVFVGILILAMIVSRMYLGRRLKGASYMIRANPCLAASSGIGVTGFKIRTFAVSGALAGLTGCAFGTLYGYVVPQDVFTLSWSVVAIAASLLGGVDSSSGPIVGALIIGLTQQMTSGYLPGAGYQVVYGAILIVCIVVLPRGLVGSLKQLVKA